MLSLGNFYYTNAINAKAEKSDSKVAETGANAAALLKDAYKFYFHVLTEDSSNVYATNGLGMVCIEKSEIDTAREIFAKVIIRH